MEDARSSFGPFELDAAAGTLRRGGEAVPLGQRAFELLRALVEADGAVVDKDTLMARAWPGLFVEEANLTVQIAALRKALGKAPDGQEWIATVPRVGYRLPRPQRSPDAAAAQRPTVAVLPFDSAGGDSDQGYFADGVAEDIITALSRFRSFAVVSRSASFAYRDRSVDLRKEAEALGVRYLLAGSVRRRGDRLRVGVQLVDGQSAVQIWGEQYDGEAARLFEFQDEITEHVVGFVEPELRRFEIERARRKHPDSLDAYELYLKALPLFRGTTNEVRAEAIRLLEGSVALDPGFAMGLAHAAWAYERQDTFGVGATPEERARALELAEAALVAGHDDPLVTAISGLVLMALGGQWQRCLAMMGEAMRGNPNNPTVLSLAAFCNVMFGDVELAHAYYLRALEISPGALDNYELLVGVGIAHLAKHEYEQAVEWSLRSLAANGDWLGTYWTLGAAYAHLDRMDEARATVAAMLEKAPWMRMSTLERIGRRFPAHMRDERIGLTIRGMRKAGMPE
jgi:TolB-like protein